jgi:hypothetical protein
MVTIPAQRFQILDVVIERIGRGIAVRVASVTAVVEVDELHVRGQWGERRLEAGVVGTGTAVTEEGHRQGQRMRPSKS